MAATKLPEQDYLRVGVMPYGLPFENGDHLDQPTFHRLYLKTPDGVKAELIGGIVFVASPTSPRHGQPHLRLAGWLDQYANATPGTIGYDNTTSVLGPDSEPEPDLCLVIDPRCGGQTHQRAGLMIGAPELVVEVSNSSVAVDLGRKKTDYEKAGVREYVVAVVDKQQVRWFENVAGEFVERLPANGVFRSAVFPGLWLYAAGAFSPNGRRIATTLRKGLATDEHKTFVAQLKSKRTKANGKKRGTK